MRSLFAIAASAVLFGAGTAALAADEATFTLRREHRLEALELRQQHANERAAHPQQSEESAASDTPPLEAPPTENAQGRQLRERGAQDDLHERQLRKQLQSAHIRKQQAPGEAASAAQIELLQLRRERDAAALQRRLLEPLRKPRGR